MMIENNINHTYTTFSDPSAVYSTYSNAINDTNDGQVVGNYVDSNGVSHVILYGNGKYTMLNDPPGKATATADLNNEGQVDRQYVDSSNDVGNGSLFIKVGWNNGTYTTLNDPNAVPPGGTVADGITNKKQVVGTYITSNGNFNGFSLQIGSYGSQTYTTINYPPSLTTGGTILTGINTQGQLSGSWTDSSGNTHGLIYSNGNWTQLDAPLAVGYTQASNINNNGEIVGYYTDSNGAFNGFVYKNGTYTTLDDPDGTNGTFIFGVNNAGAIVGFFLDSSNESHGFLYSNGTFTTLNDPLGVQGTQAFQINNVGQIVGLYTDSSGTQHGFIYSQSGGTYTTLNDPNGAGPQGTNAIGINDKSQVVGSYTDKSGNNHGFLFTP